MSGDIWCVLLNDMKVNGRVSAGDLTSSQWVLSLKAGHREWRLKTKHWEMSWGELGWFCPYFSVLSASPPNTYGWKMSWSKVSLSSGRRCPVCVSCLLGKLNRRTCSRLGELSFLDEASFLKFCSSRGGACPSLCSGLGLTHAPVLSLPFGNWYSLPHAELKYSSVPSWTTWNRSLSQGRHNWVSSQWIGALFYAFSLFHLNL